MKEFRVFLIYTDRGPKVYPTFHIATVKPHLASPALHL
jgi:hypothetical protein